MAIPLAANVAARAPVGATSVGVVAATSFNGIAIAALAADSSRHLSSSAVGVRSDGAVGGPLKD